ncbi:hypothetical protein Tco_0829988 [Tanacetum coccineum]
MLTITFIGSSASLAYSIFSESLKTQSCSEFFPLLLPELQKDGWTDSPQELSILGISLKRLLSKGIAHLPRPRSRLNIFRTSRKKETNHYIKPGNEKIQNHHDEIIQDIKSRVTTLAKEAVTKIDKKEDCKTIFTNDGAPLYTPFYYSLEEIEYFSANSG